MTQQQKLIRLFILFIAPFILNIANSAFAKDNAKPMLMLANIYHQRIDLNQYWVSEKLDGVRAYWNGQQIISRGGHVYHAPKWFIANFPNKKLDGELWIAREKFEQVVSTVRDKLPNDSEWKQVKFMAFDLPSSPAIFDQRLMQLSKVITEANVPWLKLVKQWRVKDHKTLMSQLNGFTNNGAEGLMLHRGDSFYSGKRSGDLLKVKQYQDAEAVVVKHISGKGKYKNMLGALMVRTPNNLRFKIGTGFSDLERQNPPELGATITYQYRGLTKNGIPRFASFLRIREVEK